MGQDTAQEAIVGCHKGPPGRLQQDGAAVCTHTWVDDGDVDRIIWEVTIADAQDEGSLGDVLGSYLVGEVDEAQRRVMPRATPFITPA